MRYLNAIPMCKVLGTLFVYLMTTAPPMSAGELSLICKTKNEFNSVFFKNNNGDVLDYKETYITRHGTNITLVIGNGTINDKNFQWPRHHCIGDISEKFSDTEINIKCQGVESTIFGKSPFGSKDITINRLSGDIVAVLSFDLKLNTVSSFFEGNCKKAKQKF
jgi:hypothetical protein